MDTRSSRKIDKLPGSAEFESFWDALFASPKLRSKPRSEVQGDAKRLKAKKEKQRKDGHYGRMCKCGDPRKRPMKRLPS
jgi:hypothetical protein